VIAQLHKDCVLCCSRSKVLEGSEVQTPVSNGVGHQSHVLGAVATGSDQPCQRRNTTLAVVFINGILGYYGIHNSQKRPKLLDEAINSGKD